MSSAEGAYGRKQQSLMRSLLHKQQKERSAQIHLDNRRLRDLEREEKSRREAVEKTWIQQASHSAMCRRGKGPISLQKDSKAPKILRTIEAKAAYYEDQLLTKLSFLREKQSFAGTRKRLLVSSRATYWDSYRVRRELRDSQGSSLENSLEKALGRGRKGAESSPELRLRGGKKVNIVPKSIYH